ncbi:MAG: hypothetical protein K1Y36_06910 [Blastocatellia bacterium]|nr:hypothetical protein [Blastocatellia bacterium]
MKHQKSFMRVALIILVSSLLTACSFEFSTARITDATLCKKVSDKNEPIDKTRLFDPSDKELHCVVKLGNAPEGTKLKAKWLAVQVEGEKANSVVADTDITAGGSTNVVDFSLTTASGLKPGDYKLEIYMNPKTEGAKSQPERTVSFSVQGSKKTASDSGSVSGNATNAQFSKTWFSTDEAGENTVSVFEATTKVFWCHAELKGVAPGTKVESVWLTQGGEEISRAHWVLGEKENVVRFSLTLQKPLPAGDYKVELFVGDATKPARSLPFSIYVDGD